MRTLRLPMVLGLSLMSMIDTNSVRTSSTALAERRIVPFTVSIDTLIDGNKDASLGRPLLLAVSDSLIVYFDYADNHLAAVDMRGKMRWTTGRRGQGPGEWGNPTTVSAATGGGVVVHDGGNGRLVRVDANGRVTRNVNRTVPLQRIAKLRDGQFVGFGGARGRATAELLDSTLQTVRSIPWKGWPDSAQGLGNQLRIAGSVDGTIAAVSIYTGRVMPLRVGPSLDSGVDGADARPIPARTPVTSDDGETVAAVAPGTKAAIRDASIVGKYLFVLAAGTDIGGRLLDIYEMPSARYRASIRVPVELNILSATRTDLVAISNNPVPMLLRLRWDARALESALGK
jgi:hypothetical protein